MTWKAAYSPDEFGALIGVSGTAVRQMLRAGTLKGERYGARNGNWRIPVAVVWERMGLTTEERVLIATQMMQEAA